MNGSHTHDHVGHGHDHGSPTGGWRYGVGMILNLVFVLVEGGYGIWANSTALLADAGHNLSDVLGLAMAGGAAWLATRSGGVHRTYGYGKASILAALANALLLIFACGGIVWEAITRFAQPEPVHAGPVMMVAAVGVVVNAATAGLFLAGRKHDVNVRGAFLHMASDAAVSVGVIIAGGVIAVTGLAWVDPVTSLAIVAVIAISAWGLLKDSVNLALDAAPPHVDVEAIRTMLQAQPGVVDIHDLHVWNMSTTETALTAHLVCPKGDPDRLLEEACAVLHAKFGLEHVTLQIERSSCVGLDDLHP